MLLSLLAGVNSPSADAYFGARLRDAATPRVETTCSKPACAAHHSLRSTQSSAPAASGREGAPDARQTVAAVEFDIEAWSTPRGGDGRRGPSSKSLTVEGALFLRYSYSGESCTGQSGFLHQRISGAGGQPVAEWRGRPLPLGEWFHVSGEAVLQPGPWEPHRDYALAPNLTARTGRGKREAPVTQHGALPSTLGTRGVTK